MKTFKFKTMNMFGEWEKGIINEDGYVFFSAAGKEDELLPVFDPLYFTKEGKPFPLLDGHYDPDFLRFNLLKRVAG